MIKSLNGVKTIGIDPGQKGAIAIADNGRYYFVSDFKSEQDAAHALKCHAVCWQIKLAYLEKPIAMPGQSVRSTAKQFENYGFYIGVLTALKIPFRTVTPQQWMKNLLPKKKSANDKPGLTVARRMWPDAPLALAKHDGRADAILIAHRAWADSEGEQK